MCEPPVRCLHTEHTISTDIRSRARCQSLLAADRLSCAVTVANGSITASKAGTTCPPEHFSRVNPLVGGKTVAPSDPEGTSISAGPYSPSARTDATSYSAMPVATAAFKDSTADEIGIETI